MKISLKNVSKILIAIMVVSFFAVGVSFASTGIIKTGPVVYNDSNAATTAMQIPTIKISEQSNAALGEGFFTITIPAVAKLGQAGSQTNSAGAALTRSTAVLGTSASPKSLYVLGSGANDKSGIIFLGGTAGSQYGILRVYNSAGTNNGYVFGTGTTGSIRVRAWDATLNSSQISNVNSTTSIFNSSSTAVGKIYFNDTTNETVISLAIAPQSTTSAESMYLEGLYLAPSATGTTGSVDVGIANGDAAGAGGAGFSAASASVMTLVTQPASLSGTTAPSTVPAVNAGSVTAQPIGVTKLTFVGTPTSSSSSTIIFALNNGAKFHSNAGSCVTNAYITQTTTGTEADSQFTVDASGNLVWTLANPSTYVANAQTFQFDAGSNMINANGVTTAGDITCSVSGTGAFAALNTSVLVASAQLAGVDITFIDDTTAGVKTLYTGRNNQELNSSEYIRVGEKAPTSLLSGGSIVMTLNNGAKFQTTTVLDILDTTYTTSPYTHATFAVSADSDPTASASLSISVDTPSSGTRGAFTIAQGGTLNWLDLRAATAGPLQMTFSGTAGASGVVTIATMINATTTTALTTPIIVPGTTADLPTIQIVENKAASLVAGFIGLKFPSSYTFDTATIPTVTATDVQGTASTTAVTYNSWDSTNKIVWFEVVTPSNSTAGAYTILISGMKATVTSTAGTSDTQISIGGSASTTYSSSAFGSNFGALPYSQNVTIGSIVSATVPFVGTPVVNGTAVTQTFIPAGNDIGKVGDVYVFTSGQYWSGTAWTATETAYSKGATLGSMSVVYDVAGLPLGSKIYIGYGVGLTGTNATMNSNATFVLAYTTTVAISTGTAAGQTDVTLSVANSIELYLNITNNDGLAYADIAQEWLVFGAIVGGVDAGVFFFDGTAVTAFDAALDLATVVYAFDHTADTFKVTDLNLGTLGLAAGDVFWYAYVYAPTAIDLTDSTSYSVENVIMITGK